MWKVLIGLAVVDCLAIAGWVILLLVWFPDGVGCDDVGSPAGRACARHQDLIGDLLYGVFVPLVLTALWALVMVLRAAANRRRAR